MDQRLSYTFANFTDGANDRAALFVDGRYYWLDELVPTLPRAGLRPLLDRWDEVTRAVDTRLVRALPEGADISHADLLTPVRYPNKLVCAGAVYRDHLEQMNLPAERWAKLPIFLRPPTTSIVGPGRTVVIPATTQQFDWEIELAVIISRRLQNADEKRARSAIAGYSVAIDFSCRDLLDRDSPVGVDLVRAKAQDTMSPIGPCLMPAHFVADPQQLKLRLWVNNELRQDGTTQDMLFSIDEQLAIISRYITLEPGDIVLTGSPAGSARGDDQYLRAGDCIRAEIDGVGRLDLELCAARGAEQMVAA